MKTRPICLLALLLPAVTLFCAAPPTQITVGVNSNFPPYEFKNAQGKVSGSTIDILKAIEKRSSFRFKFVCDDWKTIRGKFENEEVMMLAGTVPTTSNPRKILYSIPHTYIRYSVFVRKGGSEIRDWQDINGKKVFLESGSVVEDLLKEKGIEATLLLSSNSKTAMEKLSNGQGDCIILPKIQGFYYISELNLDNLVESAPLGEALPFCIALQPNNEKTREELNRILNDFAGTHEFRNIMNNWFGISGSDDTALGSHSKFYNLIVIVFIIGLVTVAGFVFYLAQRTCQQRKYLELQVAERNNYEKEYYRRHLLFVGGPIVFLKWNDAKREMFESVSDNFIRFGYNPQDLLSGKINYQTIIHPDDQNRVVLERLQSLGKGDFSFSQIYRVICPPVNNGFPADEIVNTWHGRNNALSDEKIVHIRWIYDFTVIVPDNSSQTRHFYGYLLEITQQKQIENELIKQNQVAQVAINTKDIFLTSMSIEINSPLNALIGLANKISYSGLSEEQQSAFKIITESSLSLKRTLQQIHDFLNILKGSIGSVPQWYVLKRLIEPIIEEFQIKAAGKRLVFEHREQSAASLVFMDADWFQKILRIIMDNAVKFTESGKIILEVGLNKSKKGNDELEVTVSDTGIGIPEEKLQQITEPFTQADETYTRKFGGIGLGLSIARNMVIQMNGNISIVSSPGKGTTVQLRLPVKLRS